MLNPQILVGYPQASQSGLVWCTIISLPFLLYVITPEEDKAPQNVEKPRKM